MIKKIIISLILFTVCGVKLYANVDTLKSKSLLFSIGNFNEDCYLDTLYTEIINKEIALPNLIMWGIQDTTTCDSTYVYNSNNKAYTKFEYDSLSKTKLKVEFFDTNKDGINDFVFCYDNSDSTNQDSLSKWLIFGTNNLSKNSIIDMQIDSLQTDTISFISKDYSYSDSITIFKSYEVYFVDNEILPPVNSKKVKVQEFEDENNFHYSIFPNPNQGKVNINVNITPFNIRVMDLHGKILIKSNNINSKQYILDLVNWDSGAYIIELRAGDFLKTEKIIKIR